MRGTPSQPMRCFIRRHRRSSRSSSEEIDCSSQSRTLEARTLAAAGFSMMLCFQPAVDVLFDEPIVDQVRITLTNPRDLEHLSLAQLLLWVEAPGAGQKALSTQYLMRTRNASAVCVGSIKYRRVHVGDLVADLQQLGPIR